MTNSIRTLVTSNVDARYSFDPSAETAFHNGVCDAIAAWHEGGAPTIDNRGHYVFPDGFRVGSLPAGMDAAYAHGVARAMLDATGARMSRPYAFVREYAYFGSGQPFYTVECPACLSVLNSGHHYLASTVAYAQDLADEHNASEHDQ